MELPTSRGPILGRFVWEISESISRAVMRTIGSRSIPSAAIDGSEIRISKNTGKGLR